MTLKSLLNLIRSDPNCKVLPSTGPLELMDGRLVSVPPDIREFYDQCGGIALFPEMPFGFEIVGRDQVVPANPLLKGQFYLANRAAFDADRSAQWFIIARGIQAPTEIITIDFNKIRTGYCYDSFWDVYATPDSKIVSIDFTGLVHRLFLARGQEIFWNRAGFDLGRA